MAWGSKMNSQGKDVKATLETIARPLSGEMQGTYILRNNEGKI